MLRSVLLALFLCAALSNTIVYADDTKGVSRIDSVVIVETSARTPLAYKVPNGFIRWLTRLVDEQFRPGYVYIQGVGGKPAGVFEVARLSTFLSDTESLVAPLYLEYSAADRYHIVSVGYDLTRRFNLSLGIAARVEDGYKLTGEYRPAIMLSVELPRSHAAR